MLLYLSAGTSYQIYDRQFNAELINSGYQVQKFNYNLIEGLSQKTQVVSLSALTYIDRLAERIEQTEGNTRYICIENHQGKLRKFYNLKLLIQEGDQIIRKFRPEFILCDAISPSIALAARHLSDKYKIPAVAIVTDVPEVMCGGSMNLYMQINARCMKRFAAYILMTDKMNEIVNPKNRPYMVMEGCSVADTPLPQRNENSPAVCIYGGALWREEAGLEYLINGFLKANIPDCELHFYGTGELAPTITEIGQKHPQIKYMGCVTNKELVQAQSRAALLVNPRPSGQRFCEYSFPSKTFEYMASGVPVLMTKLPGIPDEYFDYVYTIDRENTDGVCNKLKEIFSTPKAVLDAKGAAAREFIIKNKNNIVQSERILNFIKLLKVSQ